MAVTRAERQAEREPAVRAVFGEKTGVVLKLFELMEFAWHDCYGELSPPERVVSDILTCSGGELSDLISAVQLAVIDFRDLRMWADSIRGASA